MSGILQTLFLGAGAAIKDAYFNLVTLLLNTTATNGAQNNTFLDSSTNNFSITRNGNTTQGTFTPFSQTGWSNFFDGSASTYLSFPSNTAFAWGTGAYTVEGWLYQNARSTNETLFFGSGGSGGAFLAYVKNNGAVSIENFGTGAVLTGSANDIPLNTWVHVAYVRNSTGTNDTNIYVNGVVKATGTDATNWTNSSAPVIGMLTNNTDYAIKGYMSNFRAVKGTAVYTAAFTPPTAPLTNITNTSLLTCQSNRFVDNSSNNFTATPTGTTSVQAFSPFAPDTAYSTSLVGGSGYSGTTSSTLSVSGQPLINVSDWTVEFWMYPTQYNNNGGLFGASNGGGTNPKLYFYVSGSNLQLTGYSGGFTTILANAYPALNQWTYVSVSRSSSTGNAYLYYNGVLQQTGAIAAITGITNPFYFFSDGEGASPGFYGYMSNARVSNTARYTGSNYSIPTALTTADANTQLLTNFTNAGIYDSAAKNDLETVGNAQVSTTQAKFGTTSMYFDGTGDYLTANNSIGLLSLGTGDFTVEAFIYLSVMPTGNGYPTAFWIVGGGPVNNDPGFDIAIGSTNLLVGLTAFSSLNISVAHGMTTGTWYHVAIVRSGSTLYAFKDGVQLATASVSGVTVDPCLTGLSVAAAEPVGATGGNFNGYIDELRITKGYARYTATFTPPAAAFPIQ